MVDSLLRYVNRILDTCQAGMQTCSTGVISERSIQASLKSDVVADVVGACAMACRKHIREAKVRWYCRN